MAKRPSKRKLAKAERDSQREVAQAVLDTWGVRPDDPERQAEYDAMVAAARSDDADDLDLAFFPQTDLGNAERFARRQQGKLLNTSAIGWLFWDDRRWSRVGADTVLARAVHTTVRCIQKEAEALRNSELDFEVDTKNDEPFMASDRLAGWGRASESATKLAAIQKHGAPYLSIETSQLDANSWELNVLNGTIIIDRDAGENDPISFVPHDPEKLITKLAPVVYDPEATCPIFDRFLAEVQPNAATRRCLLQWFGYSSIGDTSEQKLFFCYGKGRNGKSTMVDIVGAILGDYGETVPIETFLDQGRGRNAGAATPDLALLPGVRFLRTSEPEKGAKLAESLIKLVTGGEPIQARHLNRDYFKFRPAFKLTMSGNYRPSISGTDEGIWRRVVLVPWPVTVAKPDPLLFAKLMFETSGILNRLLDGLRDYLESGLLLPEEVVDATATYRDDSDPLGRFLATCVRTSVGNRVQSTTMHRLFIAWARAVGEREWSAKGFAQAMKERGYRSKNSHVVWWIDTELIAHEADFAPAPHEQEAADG
jgi:putative DNA primase/helicase